MRSNVYIYIVMVSALSCLVGCHKPQEQAIQEQATENPQVASESTCGATTLDAADADKWECVPDVGHWCTDPNGCPVKGNIAGVGTRLAFAQPLPLGTGYRFGGKKLPTSYIPNCNRDDNSGICSAADASWICTLSEGCDCGAGKVKLDGECAGDTYRVGHGIPSETCNEDNCGEYCRNNQCACGEKILTEKNDECRCRQSIDICMKPDGCTVDGQNYTYYQSWVNYMYENKTSNEKCDEIKPSDDSQPVAQQDNNAEQAPEKAKDIVVPEGYFLTLGENVPGCAAKADYRCFEEKQLCDCRNPKDNKGGEKKECKCKCGKSQIAKGEECKNNKLVPNSKAEIVKNENGDILLKCGDEMVNIKDGYMKDYDGNDFDIDRPGYRMSACTCGTGKPAPGEGYGCSFSMTSIGDGSEWMAVKVLAGWGCLNMEGCKCGDSTCYPDLCLGSDQCAEFNTLNPKDGRLECDGHVLPVDVVMKGYGCYASYEFVNAPGWYCSKPEGCPCGEATCEQNQMCLAPGQCGVHKLGEPEQNKLKFLQVKRVDCNDYC